MDEVFAVFEQPVVGLVAVTVKLVVSGELVAFTAVVVPVAVLTAGDVFHDQLKLEVRFEPICPPKLKFGLTLEVPAPVVLLHAVVEGLFVIVETKEVVPDRKSPAVPPVANWEQASKTKFDEPSQ